MNHSSPQLFVGLLLLLLLLLPGCNDNGGPTPPPVDTVPPARVTNLTAQGPSEGIVTLRWTASGDDGIQGRASHYDVRYALRPLTEASWDSALVLSSPPAPGNPGETELLPVTGLTSGQWYFALKVADEVPNWSEMSTVAQATITEEDTTPPATITDLAGVATGASTVTLTWTAPGDDGTEGQAAEFDVRYAEAALTEATWEAAVRVVDAPAPDLPGSQETCVVTGLTGGTTYFFGVRTADERQNWSAISNVVSASPQALMRLTRTSQGNGAVQAVWSPDGQNLAVVADWAGVEELFDIYLFPAAGGDSVRLTTRPFSVNGVAWSPDGTKFACTNGGGPQDPIELWILDAVPGAEPRLLASHGTSRILSCTWSPDGTTIAYQVFVSWEPYRADIYTIPASGGTPTLLVGGTGYNRGPAWSPDGGQLAFASDRNGTNDLWLVPAGGGEPLAITHDPGGETNPAWSPDGSRIAFASDRSGNRDIWIMPSTGGDPTRATFGLDHEQQPSWSPDGRRIAFVSRAGRFADIWVLTLP